MSGRHGSTKPATKQQTQEADSKNLIKEEEKPAVETANQLETEASVTTLAAELQNQELITLLEQKVDPPSDQESDQSDDQPEDQNTNAANSDQVNALVDQSIPPGFNQLIDQSIIQQPNQAQTSQTTNSNQPQPASKMSSECKIDTFVYAGDSATVGTRWTKWLK